MRTWVNKWISAKWDSVLSHSNMPCAACVIWHQLSQYDVTLRGLNDTIFPSQVRYASLDKLLERLMDARFLGVEYLVSNFSACFAFVDRICKMAMASRLDEFEFRIGNIPRIHSVSHDDLTSNLFDSFIGLCDFSVFLSIHFWFFDFSSFFKFFF